MWIVDEGPLPACCVCARTAIRGGSPRPRNARLSARKERAHEKGGRSRLSRSRWRDRYSADDWRVRLRLLLATAAGSASTSALALELVLKRDQVTVTFAPTLARG